MKTKLKKLEIDWKEIKNECRNTDNKDDTDKEPSESFIKKLLISEHSPIRMGHVKFRWEGIKSWISVHFARHHIGWEKWVSTQRSDRTKVNRDKSPQDTPVNMEVDANLQALINVGRFRLCYQASPETREYMEDLKMTLKNTEEDQISDVMVPNCIYRCGCPEFKECGYFKSFESWAANKFTEGEINNFNLTDIQNRYDLYNKFFYETHHPKCKLDDTIICLLGESGCGKSTIADELNKRYGYTVLQSYTTRPKRNENETGHIFVTEDYYQEYLVPDQVAYTEFDEYHYCATKKQVDESDIYIIDLAGLKQLRELYKGKKQILAIYIDVPEITRFERMVKRGDSKKDSNRRIYHDHHAFKDVEKYCDYVISGVYPVDYYCDWINFYAVGVK